MDSALDFGSSGCGFESHQGRIASMAQRIAHRTSNPGVAGSNPAGGVFLFSGKVLNSNCKLLLICKTFSITIYGMKLWRNGSASDSRPEGWGFESL